MFNELTKKKIVTLSDFQMLRQNLRKEGRKVVLCHGVFDLLHPGHIAHMEEARSLGDVLIVSVTASSYVNKGPGRPYFSDELRMQSLAALACVDFVLLSESPTAQEILDIVQPDKYVKGHEYADETQDVTGNINSEIAKVRSLGGDVHFTNGIVFSSTKLINQHFPVFTPEAKDFVQAFSNRYTFNDIRQVVDKMQSLRVLVVGDIIIDEYFFCRVQGLMSKDRAFSARYIREDRYMGGALAIARHIANFSNQVAICSMIGDEPRIHSQILNELGSTMLLNLQIDPNYRTVVKRRFIERHGMRNEYDKLFSINYLMDDKEENAINREAFQENLLRIIDDYDLVVVADYGHGLLDQSAMSILQNEAKFLALNCQNNSSNYGTNLITKYGRADTFTLDESELRLAFASKSEDLDLLLKRLMEHFRGEAGWLTLGSFGSYGIDKQMNIAKSPALTLTVQDTVGAGDAFFSLASLCARLEAPVEIGSFISNIAGALAANILGNSQAVRKADLLKFVSTFLKF